MVPDSSAEHAEIKLFRKLVDNPSYAVLQNLDIKVDYGISVNLSSATVSAP
jgi:hypothetical protein